MGARSSPAAGFDLRLVFRLARQPVWLLGIASMILGFVFQLTALRFGELAVVQPILAAELLFVFGYLALAGSRRVKPRDWLAAATMSAGIGVFLCLASPSGGRARLVSCSSRPGSCCGPAPMADGSQRQQDPPHQEPQVPDADVPAQRRPVHASRRVDDAREDERTKQHGQAAVRHEQRAGPG